MPNGKLTKPEAIKTWVLRAAGWKVRDIQSRFDVDPRRLYDVWEEQTHKGTRSLAIRLFEKLFPNEESAGRFDIHQPRFERRPKGPDHPILPGL